MAPVTETLPFDAAVGKLPGLQSKRINTVAHVIPVALDRRPFVS